MSNWYDRHIMPHIIRLGCGCQLFADLRAPIIAQARGHVLELGMGASANLPHYGAGVETLTAIEPSAELRAMALATPGAARMQPRLLDAVAEELPFADQMFDTVVCTFTLCTVTNPARALGEARRVLRPGGQFLFCEHGRAPDAGVTRWQEKLDPLWRPLFGGCNLSRPVRGSIERSFAIASWAGDYQPRTPRIAGWVERGVAMA